MDSILSGHAAALATAVCWAAGSLAFTAAGQRVGSRAVHLLRLPIALVLITATAWLLRGRAMPTDISAEATWWLVASGLVGFSFGDLCLFRAFVVLGARLSSLLMSLAPLFAAVLGWLLLDEVLLPLEVAGMALTLAGIVLSLSEPAAGGLDVLTKLAPPAPLAKLPPAPPAIEAPANAVRPLPRARPRASGVLLAVGGAIGQGGGLVLSKIGLAHYPVPFAPLAASQIRIAAGLVGFMALFVVVGWREPLRAMLADRRALAATMVGAFCGPFLGVTLSLYAVAHAPAGVAASLMATSPLLVLPATVLLQGERVGWRGVTGTVIAVAGVALLVS